MMKRTALTLVFAITAAFGSANAQLAPPIEVRGTVEQWAPGARVIKVAGETYALSKEVQVIDRNTKLLKNNDVRAGVQVLLMLNQGEVSHVVVNPGTGPIMDQPQR